MSAELDKIAAEALADETAAPAAGPGPAAAPAIDPLELLTKELSGLTTALVSVLSPALPSLKTLYTEETIGAAAGAIARVCVKHGWLTDGMMGEYGEEIAALLVVGPLAVATAQGVKSDLAKMRTKPSAALGVTSVSPAVSPAPTLGEPAGDVPADLLPPLELVRG